MLAYPINHDEMTLRRLTIGFAVAESIPKANQAIIESRWQIRRANELLDKLALAKAMFRTACLAAIGVFAITATQAAAQQRRESPAAASEAKSILIRPAMPEPAARESNERMFLDLIANFSNIYASAPNRMSQATVPPQRANALCVLLPDGAVRDWVGTIETLSSTDDGRGILGVRISSHVTLETVNNPLSELLSATPTLIPTDSRLFRQLSSLRVGQPIVFSGYFVRGEDCFTESSLTVTGAMQDPYFQFRFIGVRNSVISSESSRHQQPVAAAHRHEMRLPARTGVPPTRLLPD
jgi:hypothetical protein